MNCYNKKSKINNAFNLSKWLYYDYTSNLAYRPTQNKNIPLISCQKQRYVLLILYHAHSRWHKSKSPSKPCQWSLLADGLHLIFLKTTHIMAIETVLSTLNGIIRWLDLEQAIFMMMSFSLNTDQVASGFCFLILVAIKTSLACLNWID